MIDPTISVMVSAEPKQPAIRTMISSAPQTTLWFAMLGGLAMYGCGARSATSAIETLPDGAAQPAHAAGSVDGASSEDGCCTGCVCSTTAPSDAAPADGLAMADAFLSDGQSTLTCGGFVGATCPQTSYCLSSTHGCNHHDEPAYCQPRPHACPPIYAPVCGCDGKVYPSECDAAAAGVDISNEGGCTSPAGTFACGGAFCVVGAHYCERTTSDVGGFPDLYACRPLPPACQPETGISSCACLTSAPCGGLCSVGVVPGTFTVICPGG